ncbi:MAG: hypothetical protein JSW63_07110 [Ignavibacterium sp.]|nr:MAG: hypothetical protein JSW63_07110 [Ignavibacterium sp.]
MNKIIFCSFIFISVLIFVSSSAYGQETLPEPVTPMLPSWDGSIDEKEEAWLLEKLPPELKADLLKVKEVDPEQYTELLRDAHFVHHDIYTGFMDKLEREFHKSERKIDELDLHTKAMGIQYQHASQSDKQTLKGEIRSKLGILFDLKEKKREVEIQMLEKELAQLKESLIVRKKNKDDIILRRLSELTGTDEYLDW